MQPGWSVSPPRRYRSTGGPGRWVVAVLLVLVVYTMPLGGSLPATNPNEVSRLELAAALALWARPEISPVVPFWGLSQDRSEVDGRLYSDKAPGLSLAAVPALWAAAPVLPHDEHVPVPRYWPVRHLLTWLLVALPAALLPFLLVRAAGPVPQRLQLPVALLLALATPMLPYGTVFLSHAPAAVLVASGWILLLRPGTPATPSPMRALAGGLAMGLAVTTEYPCVLLAAVAAGVTLLRRPPRPVVLAVLCGLLLGVAPAALYHLAAFGSPWTTGYAFKADQVHAAYHARGFVGVTWPGHERLWGILVSARRGLLFYCPVLLLAVPGMVRTLQLRPRDGRPLLMASLLYVAFAAGFVDWEAGWSAAARHLTPVLPLLWLAVAEQARAMARRRVGWWLLAAGAGASAAGALLSLPLTPFFPEAFSNPLGELVLPSLSGGAATPNLLSAAGVSTRLGGWLVTSTLVVAGVLWAVAVGAPRRVSGLIAAAICALAAATFVTAVWLTAAPADAQREVLRAMVLRRIGADDVAARLEAELGLDRPVRRP